MRKSVRPTIVLALILLACHGPPRIGPELSRWETFGEPIHVRIIEHTEVGAYLNGAYYVVESLSPADNNWHHVMTFRHDHQIGIPKDAVTVTDGQIAHVVLGWMLAVTRDSGRSWSVWNAKTDLPGWLCCNYRLIRKAELGSDGRGIMTLNPVEGRSAEVPRLYTTDYGQSWSPTGG